MTATGGTLIQGRPDRICSGVSTDSRNVDHGNLFIALVGDRFDGHEFISNALKEGASGILIERKHENYVTGITGDVPVICVDDTVKALGNVAHAWRRQFKIPVIAITGSSGKTTTKEMAATIISLKRNVLKNRGNFNNLIGVPLTLLEINEDHEVAVVEMGTNQPGEIARLTEIVQPDIGVITNVGPAHLEGLKSLDGVREEKGSLFTTMDAGGIAVINQDDEAVRTVAKRWGGKTITFGTGNDAVIRAEDIRQREERGITFSLIVGDFKDEITMSILGDHNIYNALAATACSRAVNIDHDIICQGLAEFRQVSGRMELHRLRNGAYLVDDTYNANPASAAEALRSLQELKGMHGSTVIFGDMLELGDHAEEIHEDIGRQMADTGVGKLFLRGKFSHAVAAGAQKHGIRADQIFFIDDAGEIADRIASYVRQGDWVLIKGSRMMRMEEITHAIIRACDENTEG